MAGAAEIQVPSHLGTLSIREDGTYRPLTKREFRKGLPEGSTLRSGDALDEASLAEARKNPPAQRAALVYNVREMLTLSPGAGASRESGKDGAPVYVLSGAVHLYIDASESKPTLAARINGLRIATAGAHLFFNGWGDPPSLTLVSGTLTLFSGKGKKAREIQMAVGERVLLDPDAPIKVPGGPDEGELSKWARMPGFSTAGPYQRAGEAIPSDQKLLVLRHEVEELLEGKRIPVMTGDRLSTQASQRVRVNLDNGDRMRLTGKARFTIEAYSPKPAGKMLFSVFGRLRALIGRRVPGTMRFRTPTAVIGIKGTDFESISSAAQTEVSVVDGLVGVADPAGKGEVDVPAGMTTTVVAGLLPTPPAPIPADRLRGLRSEGIALESVNISEPTPGQVLRSAALVFSVQPDGAGFQVSLDGAPTDLVSGDTLPALADGPHEIRVTGPEGAEPVASVAFTVDNTPPALAPGVTASQIAIAPGGAVSFAFSEALASAAITVQERELPLTLAEGGKSGALTLPPELLGKGPLPYLLSGADPAGNAFEIKGTLAPPPAEPMELTIGDGSNPLTAPEISGSLIDIPVSASRKVASWRISLDGQDLTVAWGKPPPGTQAALPASLIGNLKPGSHALVLKVADEAGNEFSKAVTLIVKGKEGPPPASGVKEAPPPPPPPPAPPKGVRWNLKEAYEGSIAGTTGTAEDRAYLTGRGKFLTGGEDREETSLEVPGEVRYREPAPSIREKLADPAFADME